MNFDALTAETIQHLQALIQIDTSNPPGNESLAADYIAGTLQKEGIPFVMPTRTPGRANLVARLKGDGREAPLLLMGHTDVVPAEPTYWKYPPFSGTIAEDHLWGRGALDMKFMVAYELAVFLTLHRSGATLNRDLIFAATADEEIAEQNGIDWLALEHPDLIRADFALNELGATTIWLNNKPVYGIQVAEKGVCWMRLMARGKPGHASVPSRDNPINAIARQAAKLASYNAPVHIPPTMQSYLEGVASILETSVEMLVRLGSDLNASNPLGERFPDEERRTLYANLHNTAVPTELHGGYKTNVIPSQAALVVDGRTLPGFDTEAYLREMRPALDPDIEVQITSQSPPLEVPFDTPLYSLMRQTLERLHPGAVALPMLMTGATDAKFLAPLGVKVYGFSPIRFEAGAPGAELIHSHNERIPINGLAFGVRALYDVVSRFCDAVESVP